MANSNNSRQIGKSKEETKIRILAIERMLKEGRKLTCSEILRKLDLQYDIQIDRKTLYSDIYAIDKFMPIEVCTGRYGGYKLWGG
jgi:predicted DNA-binding transcriptional regulator YafY